MSEHELLRALRGPEAGREEADRALTAGLLESSPEFRELVAAIGAAAWLVGVRRGRKAERKRWQKALVHNEPLPGGRGVDR